MEEFVAGDGRRVAWAVATMEDHEEAAKVALLVAGIDPYYVAEVDLFEMALEHRARRSIDVKAWVDRRIWS